ncbi:MAG: response regulator [Deltaproteobacteria bacterium]|nr:response regulator [Deltaproteobacteria bacterium]
MPKAKILLVDDVQGIIDQERAFLDGRDLEISEALNGLDALKLVKTEKPNVVFLDLNLPGLNGDAVCKTIKTLPGLERTAVIIVTGDAEDKSLKRCFQAGCDAYVVKPMTRESMLEKLDMVLSEQELDELEAAADVPSGDDAATE